MTKSVGQVMGKAKGKHIRGKTKDGKKVLSCNNCGKEITLDVDENSMEGMMGQMTSFTSFHIKCRKRK